MSTPALPRPGPDESARSTTATGSEVLGKHLGKYQGEQVPELERLVAPLDDSAARARSMGERYRLSSALGAATTI